MKACVSGAVAGLPVLTARAGSLPGAEAGRVRDPVVGVAHENWKKIEKGTAGLAVAQADQGPIVLHPGG